MAENRTLLPWLEDRIWPLEAAHTPETLTVSVILSLKEIISTGSTGLLDMGSLEHSEITVGILRESGIRAVACNALMDRGPDYLAKPLGWLQRESERVRRECRGNVAYGYAPRFVLSCSTQLWEWLKSENGNTVRTTHAAEAEGEIADGWIKEAGGNIRLLHSLGFLSGQTCLAHCVHLQPGETEILKNSGTAVVHCPWTNLKLGSGIADTPELLRNGIPVFLGSDGAPCNNMLDLSGDARLARNLAAVKGGPDTVCSSAWEESTGTGAAAFFGFTGFEQDSVELELTDTENEELEYAEDKTGYLMDIPRAGRVSRVICVGKTIFDKGEFPTLPKPPMTVAQAREIVWNRALSMGMRP